MKKLLRMTSKSSLDAIVSSMKSHMGRNMDSATCFEVGEGRQVASLFIVTLGRRQQIGTGFGMPITGTIHHSPWGMAHDDKQFTGFLDLSDETVSIEFTE